MQALAEGGLEAALALGQRLTRLAQADTDAVVVADIAATALAMDRAGRFVRRGVAMEERIAEDALAAEAKTREERAERSAQRQTRITQRKRAVHDAVTEVIHFQERDEEATERLFDDVDDWVDAAAAELFAGERPIGALVAQACREVGLPIRP